MYSHARPLTLRSSLKLAKDSDVSIPKFCRFQFRNEIQAKFPIRLPIGTPKRRVDQVKKVVFEKNAFEFEVLFKHAIVNVETQLYFKQK